MLPLHSLSLLDKLDEHYILGEIGGRLLQTVGLVRGIEVQTLRFQAKGATLSGGGTVPVQFADGWCCYLAEQCRQSLVLSHEPG
jgi:hypothetical protein